MKKLLLSLCALPLLTGPAIGQVLAGHNTNAPVDVEADRIEVQDRADRAMFIGNVRVRQGGLSLSSARLTVAYDSSGSGVEIQRIDASGGVTVSSADQTAQGDIALYDLPRRLITVVGGVTLTQGASQVRGSRLVIDLNSGRAVVDGNGISSSSNGNGRVTGRFTVSKKAQ